jgi:hypothetical protein
VNRIPLHEARRDGFAIEPLLEIIERRDDAVPDHQQLTIDDTLEAKRCGEIRKAAANIIAGA